MIRAAVHQWLRERGKSWAHDRSATIGASEIGQCARRVWFGKHEQVVDESLRGAAARGDLIEQHVWLPALAAALPQGAHLEYAGTDQRTLTHGYLSATCDAVVTGLPKDHLAHLGISDASGAVLFECKSIDPRVDLREAKAEHRFQAQVQLGIVRAATEWKPTHNVVSYINASFLDDVREYPVEFDPAIFANAESRALAIMDAVNAIDVRPEGKMAGGKECEHCAFASRCAGEQVAAIPDKVAQLGDNARTALDEAAQRYAGAKAQTDAAAADKARAAEDIKEILRGHGSRKVATDVCSVAWSTVKGRASLDLEAVKQAGLDLSPFQKTGDSTERLSITMKDEG